jgi:hypothetical protein
MPESFEIVEKMMKANRKGELVAVCVLTEEAIFRGGHGPDGRGGFCARVIPPMNHNLKPDPISPAFSFPKGF